VPKVYVSSVINAPIADVWAVVRNFNSLSEWHPAIRDCRIERQQAADQVGCIRILQLQGGGAVRERLLELSDREHCYSYSILEAPFAVTDYVATLQLLEITDGAKTLGVWSVEFQAAPEEVENLRAMLARDVFQAGFDGLNSHLRPATNPKPKQESVS
jgi:hypothetical protein